MIFRVKIIKKINEWMPLVKKFIIYLFEQVYREQNDCKITMLGDCTDAGISNVDLDLLIFTKSLINYYPMILNAILVNELPSILSYILKLIHSFLPQNINESIDPITKIELNDYVDPNELPDFLDGTCNLPYREVPNQVLPAYDLAKKLEISKSATDQLIKHLESFILSDQISIS